MFVPLVSEPPSVRLLPPPALPASTPSCPPAATVSAPVVVTEAPFASCKLPFEAMVVSVFSALLLLVAPTST